MLRRAAAHPSNLGRTNLVDVLCLLLFLFIMLLLLAYRLLSHLIGGTAYRNQLVKNTRLLGALGTMLLFYAFSVVKWITHFLPN